MIKEKGNKRRMNKLMVIGISLSLLIGVAVIVSALTDNDRTALESELNNLTSDLTNNNYDWLVNYNISYPQVEVYEKDGGNLLAVFNNIINESWYKIYLTNLSNLGENYTQDVFDLKSAGNVERINHDMLRKKMRIDEIRRELKNEQR